MSLNEAIQTLPGWVGVWLLWLNVAVIGSFVVLLFSRRTWRDAAAILAANALMVPSMQWLYGQVGFVRLLGLPHVVFWTPLVIWLVWRLRTDREISAPFRQVMWVLVASLCVSLAFDVVDVARYLAGETGSMLPAEG